MTKQSPLRRAYPPSFIHAFYAWFNRLPIPPWVLFVTVFVIVGVAQHLVAWGRGLLATGLLNFDLATAGYWLAAAFLIYPYMLERPLQAFETYRPLLNVTDEEFASLKYNFVTIPRGWGNVLFLLGLALGAITAFSDMSVAPPIDYAFPALRIGIWIIGTAMAFPFVYQGIRQLRQIGRLYAMPESIDLSNLRPLYGFPRYTAVLGIAIFFYSALLPAVIDPTAFASQFALVTTAALIPLVLLLFYLPLSGVHRRLVNEKDRLLEELNARIAAIRRRIHAAAFDHQNLDHVGDMRSVLTTLVEEKVMVEGLSTWPWRPGTLTGLLSALLVPILLVIVREIVSRLLAS